MPDQTTNPIDTEATAEPTLTRRQWTGAVRAGADAIVRLSPNSTAWAKSNAALTAALPLLAAPAQNRTAAMPDQTPDLTDLYAAAEQERDNLNRQLTLVRNAERVKTDQRDRLADQLAALRRDYDRQARELATARGIAQGNKRHVATLSVLLERIEKLTVSTDGDDLDPDVEIPIGEIRRALNEPIGVTAPVPGSSRRAQETDERRGAPRIVPYAERKPLYAAYRAAHAEADRIGGKLSDDSIVQAAVKAYEAGCEQLRAAPAPMDRSEA